ncbi:unnamed protein product, partial [Brenthis ino]
MQLIQEQSPVITVKDMKMRDVSSHNFDVKEKRSSDASLFMMNPVASGDNVAMELNANQKHKEDLPSLPPLVPCCEGKELQIKEDLLHSGLSAISVKHDSVTHCLSMSCACERMQVPPGLIKHRNSFRSLHRPDLKRVPYLRRLTPDELEALFRGYSATSAKPKKNGNSKEGQELKLAHDKVPINLDDGNGVLLHPIPETRSGAEDVPAGMRLHGARARLYTSVLAGVKTGDQLDNASANETFETHITDILPDEEVQLHEEVQIILPPRCDDITAESSTTNP